MAFEKGQSGNPGGRPKQNAEIKALAREHGASAIAKLVELIGCGDARTELAAAQALLDRGYGKPSQAIIGGDDDDPAIKHEHSGRIELVALDGPASKAT